jgi:hypothetical protein
MEKMPTEGNNDQKKSSKFDKTVRSALAGAALFGVVGGAEIPKGVELPHMKSAEAHEIFNANKEAEMFIADIELLQIGIDDARGRAKLRIIVEEKLKSFALALKTKTPVFSADGNVHVQGDINAQSLERAKQYLIPRIMTRSSKDNPGIEILKNIVNHPALTPKQKEGIKNFWKEMGN